MKNILIPIMSFCFLLTRFYSFGQVPQKFNYQGIARDTKGNPMAQQRMTLKLTVLPASDATESEYEEIQTVTTNEFGLYTLQIGNGKPVTGEMKAVKWETGNKYIKVAIDPKGGNDFVDAGTNQLLSVPYAIYADKAGTAKNAGGGDRTGAVSTSATGTGTANFLTKFTAANTIYNSQIFDNGTNIGIGTNVPNARLHLYSTLAGVQPHFRMQSTDSAGGGSFTMYNDVAASYATFTKYGTTRPNGYPGISTLYPYANLLAFGNNGKAPNDGLGRFLIVNGGNVGISIFKGSTSKLKFHADYATENVGIGGNSAPVSRVHLNNTDGTTMDLRLTNSTTLHTATDGMVISMNGDTARFNNRENSRMVFATNNIDRVTISSGGDVGLGTTAPTAKLDVNGQIRMQGGTPGLGKVLTSDATGLATWQTPSAGGTGFFQVSPSNASHIVYTNTANYGKNFIVNADSVNYDGAGTDAKMMFIGSKSAYRAGAVNTTAWNLDSIGLYSIGLGLNTKAKGQSSIAMGENTTASGNASTAMGYLTTASGLRSTALGIYTTASGTYSSAMGESTTASGSRSTAIGEYTTASGSGSTAMGSSTNALGSGSTAMGFQSTASGAGSTAMGSNTNASGNNSTASGNSTKAESFGETVIGSYNDTLTVTNPTTFSGDTNRVFTVGNGTEYYNRSTAFVIQQNGNVGVGVRVPQTKLDINGQIKISGGTPGLGKVLTSDANGLATWQTPSVGGTGFFQVSPANTSHIVYTNTANYGKNFIVNADSVNYDGAGTDAKMMFIPSKYAFRAGLVYSANWNMDSIGLYSIGLGANTKANGEYSFAMGYISNASGNYSTAMGYYTIASASTSTAMGYNTTASGTTSTAMGYQTDALGTNSTAMGDNTTASASASTAMGFNTNASGTFSTAMGYSTTASGYSSTAIGSFSNASGNGSTAMGSGTTASGGFSTAMGSVTTASGSSSTAMGTSTIASGNSSTASGNYSKAKSYGETVIGNFNDTLTVTNPTSISNDTNRVFTVGNGGSTTTRSTAFVIQQNGNVGVGVRVPQTKLDINGQIKISGGTPGLGKVLTSDATGLATWQTPAGGGGLPVGATAQTLRHDGTNWVANAALTNNGTQVGIGIAASSVAPLTFSNGTGQKINFFPSQTTGYCMGIEASELRFAGGTAAIDGITFRTQGYSGVGSTERLRIAGDGNVGIGTNTPSTKLDVNGQIRIQGGIPGAGKVLTSDATGLATWQTPAGGGGLPAGTSAQTLRHDGTNWVANSALTNNGTQVGIGIAASSVAPLTFSNGTGQKINFLPTQSTGYCMGVEAGELRLATGTGANDAITFVASGYNGTERLRINGNGNVGIGTNLPTALLSVNGSANNTSGARGVFSDRRVKKVNADFTDGLNVINKIHTVKFTYNENAPFKAEGEQIGVIAQELEKIAPYMVSTKEYGNIKDLREVNNQAYTFLLINAVKELSVANKEKDDAIAELKAENQHTNDKLKELEAKLNLLINPTSNNNSNNK